MGWSYYRNYTKAQLIEHLTKSHESVDFQYTCIKKCLKGNALWTVWDMKSKESDDKNKRVIELLLVSRHDNEWGYKGISESAGPFYYSCPLSYLDMVPVADAQWREQVKAYHSKVKPKIGLIMELTPNALNITALKLVEKNKKWIGVTVDGERYQIRSNQFTGVAFESWETINA